MTMPADAAEIVRLAERVEQATGGDAAIDRAIRAMAGPPVEKWEGAEQIMTAPYTTSLDAAMTLVPEGAGFNLDRYWIREGVRWKVEIATGGIPEQPRQVFDCWDAYTAPLATVAAALRARAAQHDHEVG